MTKELTTIKVSRETKPVRTEQWLSMPVGTTFIHPSDGRLCLKISEEIMFDLEEKEAIDVEEFKSSIWDFSTEEPLDFELVDIAITVKRK